MSNIDSVSKTSDDLMNNKVAIVIVNWNSFELTNDTIQSLQASLDKSFDIIVVDNGSNDHSVEQLELLQTQFDNIVLIKLSSNTGFTGGNNAGMKYSMDKGYLYTLLLNNDVEVSSHFLKPLIEKFKSNPQMGAVQPLIYFHHDHELVWNAGSTYYPWLGITNTIGYNTKDKGQKLMHRQQQVDWITGCAMMIKNEVLDKVGLLEMKYFIYYEDVDLSFRIKNAGYELGYEPSSIIYHIAGMSHKSKVKGKEGFLNPKVHYLNARNRIWTLKKYVKTLHLPTVILYQMFYFFGIGFYFIFRARWNKWKAWNKGIWEGLMG